MRLKKMAKNNHSMGFLKFVAWFTGVIVALVVAFGMTDGTLGLPYWLGGTTTLGMYIVMIVGWIVLVTTLLGVILAIFNR